MKYSRRIAAAACVLLIAAMLGACSLPGRLGLFEGTSGQSTELINAQKQYTITIPAGWSEQEDDAEDVETDLFMANKQGTQYVMVLGQSSEDYADDLTVKDYTTLYVNAFSGNTPDAEISEIGAVRIGELDGYSYEVKGEFDNMKLVYFITCVQTDTEIVHLMGWSVQSQADEAREVIRGIVGSFRAGVPDANEA